MTTGVIQTKLIFRFPLFSLQDKPGGFSWQLLQVEMKILEGYEAEPRVALPDLEIDDSEGRTSRDDKALKIPFVVCPASSLTRQSPASGHEHVPEAVNGSKMD